MSLNFHIAEYNLHLVRGLFQTLKVDPIINDEDYTDKNMLKLNDRSAAMLIPLLNLPVDDGYGEINAADLYKTCSVSLTQDFAHYSEFTCATDEFVGQVVRSLMGSNTRNVIVSQEPSVLDLKEKVERIMNLAMYAIERHGSLAWIQMS